MANILMSTSIGWLHLRISNWHSRRAERIFNRLLVIRTARETSRRHVPLTWRSRYG